ncbi:peptidoglycan DD-metalloendopeptidase family protein [Undibacter mobilis]|uniref:LysM peptidoglycan-binding domain-containing protein n=1 Tax=Undibacter mobilis TaxID=2292256 RepID=A0A371B0M6_9BRAD|nr:peptidoglycan DD-metalloendopeptidase family protein [Undibacter mobilis]RDV01087.1 LysM peptidoglycan-binding domain-containing protein [Undibacter mobilis]
MSRAVVSFPSRVGPRVAAVAALGIALAGCSNSSRFDSPYPTASRQTTPMRGEVTGSIATRPPAPTTRITSQPLPTPPQTVASGGGTSGGSQGLGAYRPAQRYGDVTGSVSSPPQPAGQWTWDGGHPVTVGNGETVDMIARRQGVPVSAILQTNGISDASQVRPGQRLVIPRYVSTAAPAQPAPQVAAPAYTPAPAPTPVAHAAPAAGANVHVIAPGESLIGVSRRYGTTLTELARYNGISPYTRVNVGDRIKVPGNSRQTVAQQSKPVAPQPQRYAAATPAPQVARPQTTAAQTSTWPNNTQQVAQPRTIPIDRAPAAEPTQSVRMVSQETPKAEPAPEKAAEPAGSLQSFRWPVHGRVIAGFGSKPNGTQNDGINIAVPEGTQIKAADDGVVAYSGNELKGYGNLVLVRHANGYVSAYANASELLVKRGDTIRRGQVIALSGQTGNVTSPQLHFEIRKGSTPVDPTKYLASN